MPLIGLVLALQNPVLPKVAPAKTLGERRQNFINVFHEALTADQDDDRYDLGFHDSMGEWPGSSILFPAGSASEVIFMFETPEGKRLITCYRLKNDRPTLAWQIALVKAKWVNGTGTLAKRVLEWDPDYRLPSLNGAELKKDIDRVWPYAHYIYQGDGGTIARYVPKDGSLLWDPDNAPDVPQHGFYITYLERKFLNSLKRHR